MRLLSLGVGVQSSTLAFMIKHGLVEMVDAALFADTGDEKEATYEYLDWLEEQLPFPVYRGTAGKMSDDIMRDEKPEVRFLLPTYTADGGMGKRQCTRHYKLDVIKRMTRELGATRSKPATMLIGISHDESIRMTSSQVLYIQNDYPLVDMRKTRGHCIEWMRANGYRIPPRSACTHCPFQSNDEWQAMTPREFAGVVRLDRFIRNRGANERVVQFLHRDRVPLEEVDLSHPGDVQADMFGNDCVGMCGV